MCSSVFLIGVHYITERTDGLSDLTTDRSSTGEDSPPHTPSPGLKPEHNEQPNKENGAMCVEVVTSISTHPSSILTQPSSDERHRSKSTSESGVLAAEIHCRAASNTKSNESFGSQQLNLSVGNSMYRSNTRTSLSRLHSSCDQRAAMDVPLSDSRRMASDPQTDVVNICVDADPSTQVNLEGIDATPEERGDCTLDEDCHTCTTPMLRQISVETDTSGKAFEKLVSPTERLALQSD